MQDGRPGAALADDHHRRCDVGARGLGMAAQPVGDLQPRAEVVEDLAGGDLHADLVQRGFLAQRRGEAPEAFLPGVLSEVGEPVVSLAWATSCSGSSSADVIECLSSVARRSTNLGRGLQGKAGPGEPSARACAMLALALAHSGMSTLYVREVPERVYGELRRRARQRGTSISAEAVRLLERGLEVDRPEVRDLLVEIRAARPVAKPGAPSAAELIREDRDRR